MILLVEPIWTGTHHAPGNASFIATVRDAFPSQPMRVFAEASHIAELRAILVEDGAKDADTDDHKDIELRAVAVSPLFRFRTHIVSARRFAREFAIIRGALAGVPRTEPCLLVLLSATPTAILAAWLACSLMRQKVAVQVMLHGNLNEAFGWRPRNPLRRAFDLSAVMRRRLRGVRYLVLEEAIRRELGRRMPGVEARTDVLPLAANAAELAHWRPAPLALPLRIGLVGLGTEAKGITPFLDAARHLREKYGDRVEFHLVGRVPVGSDLTRFAPLAHPVSTEPLPREEFLARLAALHFVYLPLQPEYYLLSASGGLLDAITWLKPLIVTDLPIVADLFERFGDIGYLCPDTATMQRRVAEILTAMDAPRHAAQVEALRAARAARLPAALAQTYRGLAERGFPELLT